MLINLYTFYFVNNFTDCWNWAHRVVVIPSPSPNNKKYYLLYEQFLMISKMKGLGKLYPLAKTELFFLIWPTAKFLEFFKCEYFFAE